MLAVIAPPSAQGSLSEGEDPVGDRDELAIGKRRQHDEELVATEAADGPGAAEAGGDAVGRLDQHRVAALVAEPVVDLLEAVEVDEHHRGALAVERALRASG